MCNNAFIQAAFPAWLRAAGTGAVTSQFDPNRTLAEDRTTDGKLKMWISHAAHHEHLLVLQHTFGAGAV
jgi:hypothetical protein